MAEGRGEIIPKEDAINATLSREHFADDQSIVSFVNSLYDEAKRQKWPFERQWFININFYLGRQYIVPNDRTRRFEVPDDPPHRVRHVANKIAPFVTTKRSKLTREEPTPEVQAATSDYSDFQKARLCDALLEFWASDLKLQDKLSSELTLWLCVTGNVFVRAYWNKARGTKTTFNKSDVEDPELWAALVNATHGNSMGQDELAALDQVGSMDGDVDIEVVNPFSVWVHPNSKNLAESLWVLESNVKDIDALRETWGDISGVTPDQDTDWRDYEGRLLGNDLNHPFVDHKRANFPRVIEKQLWIRPCRLFPLGKFVVVAGGKVLHHGDFPYKHGRLPYIHVKDVHVPGRFWGRSEIEDLIPIQKQINAKASRVSEIFNLHANPKWFNPRNSGVDRDDLNNSADEVIDHNPGSAPVAHTPPPLPAYTSEAIARDLQDFDDISGQREATRGEAPGRVDSASGIMALQEADDSRLGPLNRHMYTQIAEIFSQLLSLAHEFYTEKRLIRIAGESGRVEVREFVGKDLAPGSGFSGKFDVRIRVGSGLPLSRAARAQFAISLVQQGVIDVNDPKQRESFLRIVEIGGPRSSLFMTAEELRAQANLENADMSVGIEHAVNQWDDHTAHIDAHKSHMRRPQFLLEAEEKPEIIRMFEQHIFVHEQMQMLEMAKHAQQQQFMAPPQQQQAGGPLQGPPQAPGSEEMMEQQQGQGGMQ